MKFSCIYLFLCANLVAPVAAYYEKCYEDFSLCLITNTADGSKFRLNQIPADDWCKEKSSSLAIITNETVQSAITAFINDSSAKLDSEVITNGYRSNWQWINGRQSGIYPNSNVAYFYDRYAYLVISTDNTSVSFDPQASFRRKFICSLLDNNSSCPDGHQQFRGRCYKTHNRDVTWFDARNICLREKGSDLATFEDGLPPLTSEWRRTGQYWIGLRREGWSWWNKYTGQIYYADVKYSNWEDENPSATEGDCLCLRVLTGKWTGCHCSQEYRYVCIQDYFSSSALTAKTPTTKTTKATTKMTTTTAKLKTTQSTTTIHTAGAYTSQFHTAPTHKLDDNSRSKVSEDSLIRPTLDPEQSSGMILALGIGSAFLLILIVVIAVVVFIKNRRRPRHGDSPPETMRNDDAPNTVYAVVIPDDNKPFRSPSEKTSNQTVYAELDLELKRKITQRTTEPVRGPLEKASNQAVYAEVGLAPKETRGTTHDRPVPESEYANSSLVDSVYANSAQTKV